MASCVMQVLYNRVFPIPPIPYDISVIHFPYPYAIISQCIVTIIKQWSFRSIKNKKSAVFSSPFFIPSQNSSFHYVDLSFWPISFSFFQNNVFWSSCRAGLLVMNSLSFSFSKKMFLFPFWRIRKYRILNWFFFSFNILVHSTLYLLAWLLI